MNIQHLRHSLKIKWLLYYQKNRPWLVQLQVWGTYDGQRRPSSSFILAILANLEPELTQLLPLIVALSNNPDQIVAALGLNFNPDEELKSLNEPTFVAKINGNGNGVITANTVAATNGNGVTADNLAKANGNGNGVITTNTVAAINGNGVMAVDNLAKANGDSVITANMTVAETNGNGVLTQTLSTLEDDVNLSPATQASNIPSWVDESCNGRGSPDTGIALSILVLIGSVAFLVIGFSG